MESKSCWKLDLTSAGARRLSGWRQTRRPSAPRGSDRRPWASWRSGPLADQDAEAEVVPVAVSSGVQRGGPEPAQGGGGPDAPQARGDGEASAPHDEEASRPVCRPQTSPRDGVGQARRETSPYRAACDHPNAWETGSAEPRGIRVAARTDENGPPEQVRPTQRNPSEVGGSGGHEEPVVDVPVGPGSSHRRLGSHPDACFFADDSGIQKILKGF